MRTDHYYAPNPNFTGEFDLMRNDADSSYQALQAQFRHRLDPRSPDAALLYVGACHRRCFLRRQLFECAARRAVFTSAVRPTTTSGTRSPAQFPMTFPRLARGIWKSIFGNWSTDSIIYARTAPPVNVVTGLDPFGALVLSGASSVQRPNLVSGRTALDRQSERSRRKGNQSSGIHHTQRISPRKSGTKRPARIRRDAGRFDATQAVQTPRAAFSSSASGSLQYLQPPQFRDPINYMSSPLFGQSTQMLGASLGSGGQNGGLNPLYQIGGPRSAQLALKLQF